MKFFKVFLITLISLLLSGCYTQLQYSQTMKKITDNEEEKKEKVYSSNEEETDDEYSEYAEDYIPVYYKDYEYAERYKDWTCSSCNVYNFYGHDWYGYDPHYSFYSHFTLSPYRWHRPYHRYYGHPYHSRFSISLSWGWGSPYYHGFYDPFFDPYYDYYWYGYRPYAFNFRYFYGGYYYGDKKDRIDRNVRYGPRSIGTNRVTGDNNRSRNGSLVTGRSATVTSKPTVRTRSSVGTTRTRSSSDRNTGSSVRTRSRSNSDDSGTSRTRSRDNFQSSISGDRVYIDRTDVSEPVIINREQLRSIRSRTINMNNNSTRSLDDLSDVRRRVEASKKDLNRSVRTTPTFFDRMKNFFENNTSRIVNTNRIRSNSSTVRSRSTTSSSSRSSVSPSNSSSRSSVTRSRSSSSSSRSRGSSSRSRSGDSSSGGSERSRGN